MDDEQIGRHTHDALLRRTLAYVAGALAAFLPLLEFVLLSRQDGIRLLPGLLGTYFSAVGALLTVLLTGAALVSFREVVFIERKTGLNPEKVVKSLGPKSWLIRVWVGRFGDDPDSWWIDAGLVAAWAIILILVVGLLAAVLGLPTG